MEDNELSEFLDVLGAAQEVGYNLDEHYGKEVKTDYFFGEQRKLLHLKVGYKTILHLAIDEDDFDATPFVEACLKVWVAQCLMSYI